MFLFDFFRSFLPLHNPIGFGASDFIELALAALLVLLTLVRAEAEPVVQRLAKRTAWCMLAIAALPLLLRLALLARAPAPTPSGSDDFSYWLLADTLRHFRLANPAHPLRQFFETVFVLQEPSYSSIFPLGQGLALAVGWLIFGHPWAGVLLSTAALCALTYWALRAWTTPGWAVVGGLLAVMQFGVLSYWVNTYWGGAVSGIAGCLVFGGLPRLRSGRRARDGAALGIGLGLQLLTRPFEFGVMLLCAAAYLTINRQWRMPRWRMPHWTIPSWRNPWRAAALAFLPALGLMALQNHAVTGSWTSLPYQLSRYQYGVPTTFTFQANPVPHRALTPAQQLDYQAQSAVHDGAGFWDRLVERTGFYRFFFLAPLYLALPAFLLRLRERKFQWVAATLLVFAVADNFYPYFYPHYVAALACLFVLVAVAGLECLSAWSPLAARLIVLLCAAHFIFWYGIHAMRDDNVRLAMARYETWDYLNQGDPEGRIAIDSQLAQVPGNQLVFVRYSQQHGFHEWVRNTAEIDAQRVVWALDLGAEEDHKLMQYYPERRIWVLLADAKPPRLVAVR
jgi:hypothetical protein